MGTQVWPNTPTSSRKTLPLRKTFTEKDRIMFSYENCDAPGDLSCEICADYFALKKWPDMFENTRICSSWECKQQHFHKQGKHCHEQKRLSPPWTNLQLRDNPYRRAEHIKNNKVIISSYLHTLLPKLTIPNKKS